ncbi:MAG: zinc ribbon domain-containing protein [Candidatus Dadabacteria bacterium]|nr:zinc ribbon domain-containing protein [Candidatus Dadabacteria bacterium]
MPIYEYECKKCGRITEALQGFNDPPYIRFLSPFSAFTNLISSNK